LNNLTHAKNIITTTEKNSTTNLLPRTCTPIPGTIITTITTTNTNHPTNISSAFDAHHPNNKKPPVRTNQTNNNPAKT
ncbi:hypothetical protein AAHH80_41085, partial [Burkholderia pseudomallei]